MRGKFNSIIETIGDTPIVRINRLAPEGVTMWAKLEAFNPLGSVKDRLANVERIVTDEAHALNREIEQLRGKAN